MANKFYLVDGSGLIFRAFYSTPVSMMNPHNQHINSVYGFVRMIMSMRMNTAQGDLFAVMLDTPSTTFRKEIYSEYKSNRQLPPIELRGQFSIIREALEAMSIPFLEKTGYEADDLIASYAKHASEDLEVVIISSDKDFMQLIEPNVCMYDPIKKQILQEDAVLEKFDVLPGQMVDLQSLMGDSSDNIPGAKGIGPKTASKLINEFQSIENLYTNIDRVSNVKLKEKLEISKENVILSYQLARLNSDVEDMPNYKDAFAITDVDHNKFFSFLKYHGFKSIAEQYANKYSIELDASMMPSASSASSEDLLNTKQQSINLVSLIGKMQTLDIVHISESSGFEDLYKSINNYAVSLHPIYEESPRALQHLKLVSLAVGIKGSKRVFIINNCQEFYKNLKELMENTLINKIIFDSKSFRRSLELENIMVNNTFDVSLCLYAIYNLEYTGIDSLFTLCKEEMPESPQPQDYCDLMLRSIDFMQCSLLLSNVYNVYQIDHRSINSILDMERNGILIDAPYIAKYNEELSEYLSEIEKTIYEISGESFNIGSPKQLAYILFEKLGYIGKKNKNKSYKTDINTLEQLALEGKEIATHVIKWRKIQKLITSYSSTLHRHIDPETSRVHSVFSQNIASTGRLSSKDPNVQNIPIKSEEGAALRNGFIADPGNILVSADYSQIELRVLAHIADVSKLKEAFCNNVDVHSATAAEIFGIAIDKVSPSQRNKAKMINFGIIYGMSSFGLASRMHIDVDIAKHYIDSYFVKYPEIKGYMNSTVSKAMEDKYVTTILGRKCFVPDIDSSNGNMRSFSQRAAINAPIQGSAADIMKLALIEAGELLKVQMHGKAKLISQVHDELIIECPVSSKEDVISLLKIAMEGAYKLSVPLTTNIKSGKSFGELLA